jgi:hypothetical protein
VAVLAFLAGIASVADFSFTGTFSRDDQLQLFTFRVDTTSTVIMRTWSYAGGTNAAGQVIPRGGFDPFLSLFDSSGTLIGENDNGTGFVATDPHTGAAFDSYLQMISLVPGTYTLVLTQSDNQPNDGTFADGFTRTGDPTFTSMFACSNGQFCDISTDNRNGKWAVDIDNVAAIVGPADSFQVRYTSNLNIGDSYIDLTNTGASSTAAQAQPVPKAQVNVDGSICVNIYAFAADEQEVSCCSCLVTPNGLYSLSVKNALLNSVLTPSVTNELAIKLISTVPASKTDKVSGLITQTCNPATIATAPSTGIAPGSLSNGLLAWGTTLHAASTTPVSYGIAETRFIPGTLSPAELQRDVQECQFIQILGSG